MSDTPSTPTAARLDIYRQQRGRLRWFVGLTPPQRRRMIKKARRHIKGRGE